MCARKHDLPIRILGLATLLVALLLGSVPGRAVEAAGSATTFPSHSGTI